MGRTKLGDKARKLIAARVAPETAAILTEEAKTAGSLGKAIDNAAKLLARPKKRRGEAG